MVRRLVDAGVIEDGAVAEAMRAVPRHEFVPEAELRAAYRNEAVVTHRDSEGVALSSASAPGIVGAMLRQLDVRAGHRVLEIGAGTGYNAALLDTLVGPGGAVTTVDILPEAVQEAQAHLDATGHGTVRVLLGDGEFGDAAGGPYDRIIVTAGAWDVPASWADQLAPDGLLVVPLRMRGLTRSVALRREGDRWVSEDSAECGFVPIQGAGGVAERNIMLGENSVLLRFDDDREVQEAALAEALGRPAHIVWTGVRPPGPEATLDYWLMTLAGFCRVILMDAAFERGLPRALYAWGSMGAVQGGTFAYLTARGEGDERELGVCAVGTDEVALADEVAERVREWDVERGSRARIEVHPHGEAPPNARWTIDKRHEQVSIILES
ncbi:hypothetical protein GCM10009550_71640 [Actinocorallia libanotica]|uniref:Protein-L-isoaspartate O-methyltransferase n=2 Tax=Actinocorallia libanotica TaxID=46162 RepID=A0ABP4CEG1_9ACTN